MSKSKRPRDANQLAKSIVDIATGVRPDEGDLDRRNANAVELGRLGGLKGGKARAEKLSPEKRKEIAEKAAKKRWNK